MIPLRFVLFSFLAGAAFASTCPSNAGGHTLNFGGRTYTCDSFFGMQEKNFCSSFLVKTKCCKQCPTSGKSCPANSGSNKVTGTETCDQYYERYVHGPCAVQFMRTLCCKQCPSQASNYDTKTNNELEILIVVDKLTMDRYKGFGYKTDTTVKKVLTDEIKYYFQEMNEMYASLAQYGVKVKLLPRGLIFTRETIYSSSVVKLGDHINIGPALSYLKQFINKKKYYNTFKQDLTVLYTGYNLYETSDPNHSAVAGVSLASTACKSDAVAVIQTPGTFKAVGTGAHEIGHTLGAPHDDKTKCEDRKYIMASIGSDSNPKRWSFSKCSAEMMKEYIGGLKQNCMTSTNSQSRKSFKPPSNLDITDPTKICVRKMGRQDAKVCPLDRLKRWDRVKTICSIMACENNHSCSYVISSDGMTCPKTTGGTGTCDDGQCK